MSIVTFYGNATKETGNTYSAIAIATYMSIEHNMKILLISTGCNEDTVKTSFWEEKSNKKTATGQMRVSTIQSGIEGLSRMISSSKIEPKIIIDYTKVVLKGRFDILLGYSGDKEQYKQIQQIYPQVITTANQYYDMVIVDLDKKLGKNVQEEVIKASDVIVLTTTQKVKDIQQIAEYIEGSQLINKDNSIVAIGRYDETLKANSKNITRSILRQRKMVNTVPYNGKFMEATQDGTMIDLFVNMLKMQNKKDGNYLFIQEIKRLAEDINEKIAEVQMRKGK